MASKISFRVETAPGVSIVVVAWRGAPYLFDCLRSVLSSVEGIAYEVILVLNEPAPELESQVDELVRGTTILRSRVNLGFAGAVNLGAAEARGEYLVLLNDDAEVLPGWLEALVETADRRPDLGTVGSKVLFPDGTTQEIGAVIWSDGSATNVGRGLPGDSVRYNFERRVDYCSGCSLLIRRSTWIELGGFDEDFFPAYYEDVDLCLRVRALGQSVWVQPRSAVTHRLSASTGGQYRSFLLEHNRLLLLRQWSETLAAHEPPTEGPFTVDRAVSRAMGEPMNVLLVVDDDAPRPLVERALLRAPSVGTALLGNDARRLIASMNSSIDLTSTDAVETTGAHMVGAPLNEHLGHIGAPYALVLVVARSTRYRRIARLLRGALPGVPVALDAGDAPGDMDDVEAGRVAELLGSGEVDYLICGSEEIAKTLDLSGDRLTRVGRVTICSSRSRTGAADTGDVEPLPVPATPRPGATASQFERRDLRLLTVPELEATAREIEVKDSYERWLEERVERLLVDIDRRDRYVQQTEAYALDAEANAERTVAYAELTEGHAQRTEAYARELQAQVADLAAEIESKNVYIREKEADLVRVLKEHAWLVERLARAEATLSRPAGKPPVDLPGT
jgi:GT2 family glycosyltransferase